MACVTYYTDWSWFFYNGVDSIPCY